MKRGDRARIVNPKHKHYGKCGVLSDMDRGNVWVTLDNGVVACTRMNALEPAPKPTPLQEFTEKVHDEAE